MNQDSPAAADSRDASLKVDSSSLHGDELDFAKEMGFGDEPEEEPPAPRAPAPAPAPVFASEPEPAPAPEPQAEAAVEAQATPEQVSAEETSEEVEEEHSEPDAEIDSPAPSEDEAPRVDEAPQATEDADESEPIAASADEGDDPIEWEEIHPRPSADGNQGLLQTRALEVLAFTEQASGGETTAVSESAPEAVAASPSPLPASPHEDLLSGVIAASAAPEPNTDRTELNALEKEQEALSTEFETLNTEHELLLDHQAAVQGQLIRSNEEVERLQASLRVARTALAPLPEGERALRAEVLGLRDRLEAAHVENRRLGVQSETAATELAIAQAHFEDRQHEVDVRLDQVAQLERELAEANHTALVHGEKQRELLDLSTRLQAENNELRSAQVALEETLQARNLEISAREEHLAVTRDGLLSRDRQIIDLNALLEGSRAEVERANTELARRDVDAEQNQRALERREIRIASLSETLAKIDNVMGRRGEPLSVRPEFLPEQASASASAPVPASAPASSTDTPLSFDVFRTENEDDEVEEASATAGEEGVLSKRALLAPWRNGCLGEWMESMGADTLADYFAAHLAQAFDSGWPETLRVRSLGGDQLDAEIRLLEALKNRGASFIEVEVSDPNPQRAEMRAQRAESAGWGDQIQVRVGSLTDARNEPKADAILLGDALFGRSDAALELERCKDLLSDGGLLLFADQLRGGALMISPDTLTRLEEIWAVLPESLTGLPGFAEVPIPNEDGGVPKAEGPALDMLFGGFVSRADVGFGHLADLVVGPARGASLSEDDPATKRLLYSIFGLDESRSITEALPSRHGVGVFARSDESMPSGAELFAPEWHAPEIDED